MFGTETITIGSIGFAQYGTPDYFEKRKVENSVLRDLLQTPTFENIFPDLCRIKIVTERYEDGSYDEVGITYNSRQLEKLEETDEDRYNEFWEWVNFLESYDFETEELIEKCEKLYAKNYKLQVVKGSGKNGVPTMYVDGVDALDSIDYEMLSELL